ncbi:protein bric-a-brac 1 [Parasteatoda tepidariorum]|uniref:Protein bric-a-brac 2 n=1 Tax=Parasteatoda tepidariorum TaxID=114398 RepID=A0A2L2Y2Y4_PARTP|nr:protein bric-a-brac 1 [Parasteatoda tepidariorum]
MSQQFCLKWNNHMNNMMDVFKSLLSTETMVDVTLACDGLSLKAHKMVLSACSPFFQSLFSENPCQHPIVILKDMKYTELKAIIEFMYHGEVNVAQDQLSALMKTAETLRVKGLAEVTNEKDSQSNNSAQDEPTHRSVPRTDSPPQSKRRRGRTRKRSLSDSNRSDDDSNEPKIKQPMSPDIEELSGDVTMDVSSSQFSSLQSQVPMQSTPSHSSNTYKTSSVISHDPHVEEPTSADESEFGVEPTKLLEQTLTTEELNARRRSSNVEMQRRPRGSTDHSTIVPTSMSDTSNQQPDSPVDIKPEVLDLEPPMSTPGPSHSNDNAMMVYMDQSNSSHPGPSGYQDNSALVPQDSQQQGNYHAVMTYC